jgi:DNA repair photolyase
MTVMNKKYNGRGVEHNPVNRFENIDIVFDEPQEGSVKTHFYKESSKSIISYNTSPDLPINTFINPYRGCEHGCVYCYARPNHEYLGLSAGIDFETKIFVKENAPYLLEKELKSAKWQPQTIGISGVTDAYQPVEKKLELTRSCLRVLAKFRNPAAIVTKNHLVTRDIDIFREMISYNGIGIILSVTTLDNNLAQIMEPRTSRPQRRVDAIKELADNGIPAGVIIGPVIPGLTDQEIPKIIETCVNAGASVARYIMLRLPHATKDIFQAWLDINFPNKKDKIINRIKSVRDGKLYDSTYFKRDRGQGFFADQVENLFNIACRKNGILGNKLELSADSFRKQSNNQLELF